jgi:hypothetical protein
VFLTQLSASNWHCLLWFDLFGFKLALFALDLTFAALNWHCLLWFDLFGFKLALFALGLTF